MHGPASCRPARILSPEPGVHHSPAAGRRQPPASRSGPRPARPGGARRMGVEWAACAPRENDPDDEEEPMITGMHTVVFSKDADADRAFFRDVLGFKHVRRRNMAG